VYSTFVTLKRAYSELQQWSKARRVTYRVRTKSGADAALPSAGYQNVAPVEGKTDEITVTQDLDELQAVEPGSADDGFFNADYLESSAMVDAGDAEVVKLAEKTVQPLLDAAARAAEASEASEDGRKLPRDGPLPELDGFARRFPEIDAATLAEAAAAAGALAPGETSAVSAAMGAEELGAAEREEAKAFYLKALGKVFG
jgi:hypothetical protein